MEKWGVIFDSSCAISKEQVEKDGNFFISLIISINDKDYKAGEEIFPTDLVNRMKNREVKVQTSTPRLGDIEKIFNQALEKFEKVVYMGISHKFSSAQEAANTVYKSNDKYKDKIYIYDSLYSSPWTNILYEEIVKIIKNANDFDEIKRKLDFQNDKMIGYLSPGDIYWFYKGGRITKRQYFAGSLLRIKPILTVSEGRILENVIKVRTIKKALEKMLDHVEVNIASLIKQNLEYKYLIVTGGNQELTNEMKETIVNRNKNIKRDEIEEVEVSTEQTAHMGPNTFGITFKTFFPKNFFNKE